MNITIPPFYCPIPSRLCPLTEQANIRSLEWLKDYGAYRGQIHWENLTRSRAGFLAGYTAPDGTGKGFQIYCDFLYWLHTFDDTFCDEPASGNGSPRLEYMTLQLLRILEAPLSRILTSNPWAQSLRNLRQRLEECASPAQISKWKSEMTGYFLGLTSEAANRAEAAVPANLEEYLLTVCYTGAMQPSFMLTDVACGYEAPDEVIAAPKIRALADLAGLIVKCDNDITSYGKETYRSTRYGYPAPQNLVTILSREPHSSEADALESAATYRDGLMQLFLALQEQEYSAMNGPARRYVAGLGQWIRGYLDYVRVSDRFLKPADPSDPSGPVIEWPELWSDAPRKEPAPFSVSFTSWWWSQVDKGEPA